MTRVLIIEDDVFLSELLATKLKKEGFDVTSAADGQAGLDKAIADKPDIVLLDIMLPTINGFEVLEGLKKQNNPTVAAIPVLLLSNFGQDSKVQKGLELGAKDYLIKANFTTGEIVDKIKTILDLA